MKTISTLLGLATVCMVSLTAVPAYAQNTTAQSTTATEVDIYSESFRILVDSLTSNSMTGQLFNVMHAAGQQAEKAGDVRLAAVYYDKAAGYASSIGNKEAMVEDIVKSSVFNRQRNYAGTSIRQLAAAEDAVADNAALLYKVNEAQVANYEALGDVGNAYKYFRKTAEYRELQAAQQLQEAINNREAPADAAQQTEKSHKRQRAERQRSQVTFNVDNRFVAIGAGIVVVMLAAVLAVALRGARRTRRETEARFKDMAVAIPHDMAEKAAALRNEAERLTKMKGADIDAFRAQSDKVASGAASLAFRVCGMEFAGEVLRGGYTPTLSQCDADKLLKECKAGMDTEVQRKKLTIEYKSTGRCDVLCDEKSMKYIIDTLVARAMRDMTGGRILLWIETERHNVRIAVEEEHARWLSLEEPQKRKAGVADSLEDTVCNRIAHLNKARFFTEEKKDGGTVAGIDFSAAES